MLVPFSSKRQYNIQLTFISEAIFKTKKKLNVFKLTSVISVDEMIIFHKKKVRIKAISSECLIPYIT